MPAPKLVSKASSFHHPNSKHINFINEHSFNNRIDFILPFSSFETNSFFQDVVNDVSSAMNLNQSFYYVIKARIASFVQEEFISSYLKREGGSFVLISINSHVDDSNVIAISPDGKLHMSVTKETYQSLGLTGKSSKLNPGLRYNICIDLLAKSFTKGRKLHDRVLECLENHLTGEMEFLCSFYINDECSPVSFPAGTNFHQISNSCFCSVLPSYPLPEFAKNEKNFNFRKLETKDWVNERKVYGEERESYGGEERGVSRGLKKDVCENDAFSFHETFLAQIFEWLGFVTCEMNGNETLKYFDSQIDCKIFNKKKLNFGKVHILKSVGLIHSSQILICINKARELILEKKLSWVVMNVFGFSDSPFSWNEKEHGFQNGGPNDYSFFIFENDCYLSFSALSE